MSESFIPLVLVLLGLGCLGLGAYWRDRVPAAEAEARRHRRDAVSRDRMLGMLVQEMQARGLALLRMAADLPPERTGAVEAEARGILHLADEIADWREAEAGPRTLRIEQVPLQPLLEEVVAVISAQIAPGRRQWRLAPELCALTLQVDRRALRGALLQVLARVVRLTREGDWIGLRLVETPETVSIVIEDDGAGVAAGDLAAGAGAAGHEHTRGIGFGLAIARSLLEAHGGALRLEAAQGIGARAWLTLPRARTLAGA